MEFTINHISSNQISRVGLLTTDHGQISTPAFLPVATQASVKSLASHEIEDLGAEMLLSNAYHLYLRPGLEVINHSGGLHRFMSWDKPILTDSGGFQIYSLGNLFKVTDDGVQFKSHIDGSQHYMSPEACMTIQQTLGADIVMPLDHCLPHDSDQLDIKRAVTRTYHWAIRAKAAQTNPKQSLFGIIQGGTSISLRKEAVDSITSIEFPGYAIGGLSVGEPASLMYATLEATAQLLPFDKPRYLMGVGSPEHLIQGVLLGIDLFDCVFPTRLARNGALFTSQGRINVRNQQFRADNNPIDATCDCWVCSTYSLSYINHLFRSHELLGYRLATIHNLRFILSLMQDLRLSISEDTVQQYAKDFLDRYTSNSTKSSAHS
jgi:queuine tRNA-ribosyltransferase